MALSSMQPPVMVMALNKSVQEVFNTISDKKIKVKDIEKKTRYSPRTVRHALRNVLDLGFITLIPDIGDIRSQL